MECVVKLFITDNHNNSDPVRFHYFSYRISHSTVSHCTEYRFSLESTGIFVILLVGCSLVFTIVHRLQVPLEVILTGSGHYLLTGEIPTTGPWSCTRRRTFIQLPSPFFLVVSLGRGHRPCEFTEVILRRQLVERKTSSSSVWSVIGFFSGAESVGVVDVVICIVGCYKSWGYLSLTVNDTIISVST